MLDTLTGSCDSCGHQCSEPHSQLCCLETEISQTRRPQPRDISPGSCEYNRLQKIWVCTIVIARKRSLRRLCFYTSLSVILFTRGVERSTWGVHPPGPGTHLGPGILLGPGTPPLPGPGTPRRNSTPPGAMHAGRYGQQAGGTHPTGMHFC